MTDETLLLRQIHPSFVQQGRVTSQAFRPTPKDENRLSAYDGDMIAAEPAWHHFTEGLGHASFGVMAVNVAECATLNLPVQSDPEPFPEHVVIDFTVVEKRMIEKVGKQLKAKAEVRGWLYRRVGGTLGG